MSVHITILILDIQLLYKLIINFKINIYSYMCIHEWCIHECYTKTPGVEKKREAKNNQRLKALISNKAKKSVNESAT